MFAAQGVDLDLTENPVELPVPPANTTYLFRWFDEISSGRQQGMSGINYLTWADIWAWTQLAGVKLDTFERQALMRIDRAFVTVLSRKEKEGTA